MPLKQGSSDRVIQENIKCILDKNGCGYDPPYKDPAREEYTPAQAAAIAYAKAGKRNNVGKKTSASKKTKGVESQKLKMPGDSKTQSTKPQSKEKQEDNKPGGDIKVPDGWKVQQPGGSTDSTKKNQPLESKADNKPASQGEDYEKMYEDNKDLLEEAYGGGGLDVKKDFWDVIGDSAKKTMLSLAPEIVEEKKKKKSNEAQAPAAQAPAAQAPAAKAPAAKAPAAKAPAAKAPAAKPSTAQAPDAKPPATQDTQDTQTPNSKPTPDAQAPTSKGLSPSQLEALKNWKYSANVDKFVGDNLQYKGKIYTPGKILPGSTAPKVYADEDGTPQFVVKENNGNKEQVIAEHTANQVYNELSSHFPMKAANSNIVDGKLVNEFLQNSKTLGDFSPNEMAVSRVDSRMRKTLMVDALLANWDFAGLANDNVMGDNWGNLTKIDTGGTFNFRAQGDSKSYNALPMEIWTLKKSKQGSQFWDKATDDDYRQLWGDQVDHLLDKRDEILGIVERSALDDNVKAAFKKRLLAMITAYQQVKYFYDKPVSWKAIDQAIEKAFINSQGIDPNSPTWLKQIGENVNKELTAAGIVKKTNNSIFDLTNSPLKLSYDLMVAGANKVLGYKADEYENFENVTDDQKYAIYDYTGTGYIALNKYLRDGDVAGPDEADHFDKKVEVLDELLDSLPPDESPLLRMNSINMNKEGAQAKIDMIKKLQEGDTIITAGYDSYSRDDSGDVLEAFAKGGSRFHFISKYQGKNARYVDPISANQGELESLIKRGTRLRVAKIETKNISEFGGPPGSSSVNANSLGGHHQILVITYEDA
jgi:hypothetical protein